MIPYTSQYLCDI